MNCCACVKLQLGLEAANSLCHRCKCSITHLRGAAAFRLEICILPALLWLRPRSCGIKLLPKAGERLLGMEPLLLWRGCLLLKEDIELLNSQLLTYLRKRTQRKIPFTLSGVPCRRGSECSCATCI